MTQALAVKYRPKNFNEVVGQKHIKGILENQLKEGEFKHGYLFTGGAGTGKTTTARIMAKEINKGKGNPIEIDGASNNGVDNVREIIENCKFKPMDCEYKIYIIDEVHMLSTGAFNALLKTLEEPPASAIFILCTTDPQKIPATILSRVQRFDFKRLSTKEIVNNLAHIIEQESKENAIAVDIVALEYIAKLADGGMRDAITLLDTCLGYKRELTVEDIISILGTTDYELLFKLTDSIISKKPATAIEILESMHSNGKDLKQFVKVYQQFILDILKYGLTEKFEFIGLPQLYEVQLDEYMNVEPALFREILEAIIKLNNIIRWESNVKPIIESEVLLLCL